MDEKRCRNDGRKQPITMKTKLARWEVNHFVTIHNKMCNRKNGRGYYLYRQKEAFDILNLLYCNVFGKLRYSNYHSFVQSRYQAIKRGTI